METSNGGGPDVLAITSELPWPIDTGGRLRTFHLLRTLATRARVRVVAPVGAGREADVAALGAVGLAIRPARVGPRNHAVEVLRALGSRWQGDPYLLYRRHDRSEVRRAVERALGERLPDVLYLDHLDSFVYRAMAPGVPALLDLHNVYSTLARRAGEEKSPWLRPYIRGEAERLAKAERRAVAGSESVQAVSESEAEFFRSIGARNVAVAPNGVDGPAYDALPVGRVGAEPIILCLGTMSWSPNARSAEFLAREVLPRVRREHPSATLQVVGGGPPREVRALATLPGVTVTGRVPDVRPFLRAASVLAVPLDAGGGTRLKILEAFAAGLPVVSTGIGAEGIDAQPARHLVIAEKPEFAEALNALLADPDLGRRLAVSARALALDRYDWRAIGSEAADRVVELASTENLSRVTTHP